MGSIGEKGFFAAEPLLVVEIKDKPGHFHVVEGNRRLSAVKLLLYPELAAKRKKSVEIVASEAKNRPTELAVIKYPKREEILDYLGFKHITGVKSWGALAKAKYLDSLKQAYLDLPSNEQYKTLAKAIGSRSDYVKQLLSGLTVFRIIEENDYFDIAGLNETTIEFGVYYNALRWGNIRNFISIDLNNDQTNLGESVNLENLNKLTSWVSEKNNENKTRLGESRNLSKPNKILGTPKSLEAFESGATISQAFMFTDEPNEIFASAINKSLSQIKTSNDYVHLVSEWSKVTMDNLKDVKSISNNLRVILATREIEDED